MVASIIGNYLVSKGWLSPEQLLDLMKEQQRVRVKLGLIAVSEGLMTQEEANRVNSLQLVMDMRFGDIAVKKGYLTQEQVESLLAKQENAYLTFAQALEDLQLMSIEQLEQYMVDFCYENNFTMEDIEVIKSDNLDRILPLYLPFNSEKYLLLVGTAVRALMRCLDNDLYVGKAYLADKLVAANGAVQKLAGKTPVTCAMTGRRNDLLYAASVFGQEDFPEVNEDALDAIGELLNCIDGLYASAVSSRDDSLELTPPEFKVGIQGIEGKEMLVVPIYIRGISINFSAAIGSDIQMVL